MTPPQDEKLAVRSDYVCLPADYRHGGTVTDLLQGFIEETAFGSTAPSDAADRPHQEILSASLQSWGSAFIVPAETPPQSASDTAPQTGHPGRESEGSQSHLRLPNGRGCVRVIHIEETQAPLADDAALATLLAKVPLPSLVGPLLHKPFFGRKWDCTKQRDHWVTSDGTTVVSLTIDGASAPVVARVRLRFDDLRFISPGLQPSLEILHDLFDEIAREHAQVATQRDSSSPSSEYGPS